MRDYASTHQLCVSVAIREQRADSLAGAGFGVALFLESHHRDIRRDFDFPIDNRALRDRDGARADLAADDGRVADLQFILDDQTAQDGAGDDRLLRPNVAVPTAGGGQIQRPVQFTITMDFAGNHELTRAADVADEYRIDADEGGRGRTAVQKSAFLFSHDPYYPIGGTS